MGQGANITVNNFSRFRIRVDVASHDYVEGFAKFNGVIVESASGMNPKYIEYDGITSDGGLKLKFSVVDGEGNPDPQYVASTASIKLPGKHWQAGDIGAGAVQVEMDVQSWQQDLITIGLYNTKS